VGKPPLGVCALFLAESKKGIDVKGEKAYIFNPANWGPPLGKKKKQNHDAGGARWKMFNLKRKKRSEQGPKGKGENTRHIKI